MKKLFIFTVFVLSSCFIQSQIAPTLSAGLDDVTFKKGTLDVELIAKIISEKQEELVREGIKRMIFEVIGDSRLDDYSQFYIERITEILFQEKNHKVMTKRILEESTNYLFILGTTKLILDSKNEALQGVFVNNEMNLLPTSLEEIDNLEQRNKIIKTILTICSEIPEIKKLGLLNDFNYYEHFEIYENSFIKSLIKNIRKIDVKSAKKLVDTIRLNSDLRKEIDSLKILRNIKNTYSSSFSDKVSKEKRKVNLKKIDFERKLEEIKSSIEILRKNKSDNKTIKKLFKEQKKYKKALKDSIEVYENRLDSVKKIKISNLIISDKILNKDYEDELEKLVDKIYTIEQSIDKKAIKTIVTEILKTNSTNIVKKQLESLKKVLEIKKFIKNILSEGDLIKKTLDISGVILNENKSFNEVIAKYKDANLVINNSKEFISELNNIVTGNKEYDTTIDLLNNLEKQRNEFNNVYDVDKLNSIDKDLTTKLEDLINKINNEKAQNALGIIKKDTLNYSFSNKEKLSKIALNSDYKDIVNKINNNLFDKDKLYSLNKIWIQKQLKNFAVLVRDKKNVFNLELTIYNLNNANKYSNENFKKLRSSLSAVNNKLKEEYKNSNILYLEEKYKYYRNLFKLVDTLAKNIDIDLTKLEIKSNNKTRANNNDINDFIRNNNGDSYIDLLEKYKEENLKITFKQNNTINSVFNEVNSILNKIENKAIEVKLNTDDNKISETLFNQIKNALIKVDFKASKKNQFTKEDLKAIHKLNSFFMDRNLNQKLKGFGVLNFFNKDFMADLLLVKSKLNNDVEFKKILNTINFSISRLITDNLTYANEQGFLKIKHIDKLTDFLKFIGNIKELNKAETFAFLLKTMNDYEYLFANANGDKKLIPDLINSLRQYAIVDLKHNLIEIDVASVLTHILEKHQKERRWSFYATVGLNQYWLSNKLVNDKGTMYGQFNAASEKIGAKYKIWNFDNNYLDEDKLIHKVKKKSLVSDIYTMPYVSGILYKIANTSGENYNNANVGVAAGLTFFNSLDFNVSVAVPFANQPFENLIYGFSFDIPLSEYLKRL